MKTPRQQIIKAYARAFLHTYKDQLISSDIHSLVAYKDFLERHHRMLMVTSQNAAFSLNEKVEFFLKALSHSANDLRESVIRAIKQLLTLLIVYERIVFLPEILALIVIRFFNAVGYQQATVSSAQELSLQERKEIVESFKNLTGNKVDATFEVDNNLIAGLRIVSQGYLWESSIAQKIKALRMH